MSNMYLKYNEAAFFLFFSKFNLKANIHYKLFSNTCIYRSRFSENQVTALWKSVVAEGKCKGMSQRHEGSGNGRRRKSTRQREAKINGFVLSAFFQAF